LNQSDFGFIGKNNITNPFKESVLLPSNDISNDLINNSDLTFKEYMPFMATDMGYNEY